MSFLKSSLGQVLRNLFRSNIQSGADRNLHRFVHELIGCPTENIDLYKKAFTHRSHHKASRKYNNERLEFLGDSVISCVVGHLLYEMYEEDDEGALTSLRAQIVSRSNLNAIAAKLQLDKILRVSGSLNLKNSDTLGNGLEALVGAIFLDKGFDFAQRFVRSHIIVSKKNMERVSAKEEDFKTEFIILMQQQKIDFEFSYIDAITDSQVGLVHRSEILIGDDRRSIATGAGTSKKISHQNAAKDALRLLKKHPEILKKYAKSKVKAG
ncbi:ribonuclease III family protein [Porphyromonas sp.]|uniref:ribonuclease III family protein n=1 Tax=Porphyromonas sp. TaxID=1924944 RepID=UPI0026DC1494|nr:ribonuclease III domain-containing protein [Porphyromonas sp.]MDO4771908.1 ribonuclease III domain-containing protein [Porphyromonas sp.]